MWAANTVKEKYPFGIIRTLFLRQRNDDNAVLQRLKVANRKKEDAEKKKAEDRADDEEEKEDEPTSTVVKGGYRFS